MERAHHCWVIESAMICRNHRLPRRPYTITVPPLNRLPYTAQGNTQSLCEVDPDRETAGAAS